eukprot:2129941-Lingulodinium_polyedra.AAC.1
MYTERGVGKITRVCSPEACATANPGTVSSMGGDKTAGRLPRCLPKCPGRPRASCAGTPGAR